MQLRCELPPSGSLQDLVRELAILDFELLHNSLTEWLIAVGIVLVVMLAASLGKRVGLRRLDSLANRTATRIDDAVASLLHATKPWVVVLVALWAGTQFLQLPAKVEALATKVATIAVFIQVGLWCARLLYWWADRSRHKAAQANAAAAASFGALVFVGRVLLWSLILLLMLQNLGVNVNALVTSLGITGIAVALAVQNVLGDLLASLSIVLDKPFEEGDFIVVDNYMGTVEHIGIKSVRLRSLDGEQIVLSNGDLLKSRLRNYKRMYERRVQFGFRISYLTPVKRVEKIPGIVRGIIEKQKSVRFERAHFKGLGDSALEFEVVYWVTNPDFNLYMDIQQVINLQLMSALADEQVNFAAGAVVRVIDTPGKDDRAKDDKARQNALAGAATAAAARKSQPESA
jgi:small-conductance mechanosensitive channel